MADLSQDLRMLLEPPLLGAGSQLFAQGPIAAGGSQMTEERLINIFYQHYRSVIIALQASFREVKPTDEILLNANKNQQFLKVEKPSASSTLKLGDRVKIKLKHRQFKQVVPAGWNKLMNADFDNVATVIGLQTNDRSVAIVYYQRSDRRWTIHADALKSDDNCDHEESANNLRVGDNVEINKELPNYVIDTMQEAFALPAAGLKLYRDKLVKILAFTTVGAVIVSINEFESIMVNPSLLKKKEGKIHQEPKLKFKKRLKNKDYYIRNDLEKLIRLPLWHYSHTQIVGKLAKNILDERLDGLLEVTFGKQTYLIPIEYLDMVRNKSARTIKNPKTSKRNRHHTEEAPYKRTAMFPFMMKDIVQLKLSRLDRLKRALKDYGISLDFIQVIRGEVGEFIGYNVDGNAIVTFSWPNAYRDISSKRWLSIPVTHLILMPSDPSTIHSNTLDKHNKLQVGNKVSPIVAKYPTFVQSVLNQTLASTKIKEAMTSNAKLIAFDDSKDEAILEYANRKIFACPSEYITVPMDTKSIAQCVEVNPARFATELPEGLVKESEEQQRENQLPATDARSRSIAIRTENVLENPVEGDEEDTENSLNEETIPKEVGGNNEIEGNTFVMDENEEEKQTEININEGADEGPANEGLADLESSGNSALMIAADTEDEFSRTNDQTSEASPQAAYSRSRQPDSESDPTTSTQQAEDDFQLDREDYDTSRNSYEKTAKLHYNPLTRDIHINGNLGREAEEGPSSSGIGRAVTRQTSTSRTQPSDTIGGSNVTHNFYQCNVQGSFGVP